MDNNWNGNNGQQDRWNSNASNSSYYNQPTHRPYGQTFSIASAICGLLAMTTSCTIIALSCVGLVSAVSMIVYSFVMLPSLMENEAFRNQVNAVSQQLYGMDFDVFMEETYGYSFDD